MLNSTFQGAEELTTMSPQWVTKGGVTQASNRPGRLSSGFQWKVTPLPCRGRILLHRSRKIAFCADGVGAAGPSCA